MIEEAYVSFETAKLLKEKGFNYDYPKGDCTLIPITQQMAMRWLREEKHLYIEIRRAINTFLYGAIIIKDGSESFKRICNKYESYEKAVEAAIKHCLENLI